MGRDGAHALPRPRVFLHERADALEQVDLVSLCPKGTFTSCSPWASRTGTRISLARFFGLPTFLFQLDTELVIGGGAPVLDPVLLASGQPDPARARANVIMGDLAALRVLLRGAV